MFLRELFVSTTLLFSTLTLAGLDPEELVGEYLGSGDCAVIVSMYGDDQLKLSIIKSGGPTAHDYVPFYKLETLSSPDTFEFIKDSVDVAGKEKRLVSGTIQGRRFRSLKLKKVRSIFSSKTYTCNGLVPLKPYVPTL